MADIDKALTKLDKKDPAAEDAKVDAKLSKDLEDLREHSAFNGALVRRLKLPRIPIKERALQLAEGDQEEKKIRSITYVDLDVDGHKERIFGYVIEKLAYPMILGDPWLHHNKAVYQAGPRTL